MEKEVRSPLRRLSRLLSIGNLWLYVISLCEKERVYAYRLPQVIKKRFGFSPSRLLCYLVLYRLEGEGFIKSDVRGKRRYYSATKKGREILKDAKKYLRRLVGEL